MPWPAHSKRQGRWDLFLRKPDDNLWMPQTLCFGMGLYNFITSVQKNGHGVRYLKIFLVQTVFCQEGCKSIFCSSFQQRLPGLESWSRRQNMTLYIRGRTKEREQKYLLIQDFSAALFWQNGFLIHDGSSFQVLFDAKAERTLGLIQPCKIMMLNEKYIFCFTFALCRNVRMQTLGYEICCPHLITHRCSFQT